MMTVVTAHLNTATSYGSKCEWNSGFYCAMPGRAQ